MIFVNKRSEKWGNEFKMAIFRYFKHLPSDCDNHTKIIQNLNDCLFIQMPTHDNIQEYIGTNMHHDKAIIKPEIEFFYQLCSGTADKNVKLPEVRKVILLSTQEFKYFLPELNSNPPCFTKIPFLMQSLINEKIISDEHYCDKCEWGKKLITYRNILYHVTQIREAISSWKSNYDDSEKILKITNEICEYQKDDFIANLGKIQDLLNSIFLISDTDKEKLNKLSIYILEDNQSDFKDIERLLVAHGVKQDNIKFDRDPEKFIGLVTQTNRTIKDTVVILDLMILDYDKQGEDICKNINAFDSFLPIIILSGKKEIFNTINKLVGLNYYAFFSKDSLIGDDIDENIKKVHTRFFILKILESIKDAENKRDKRNYIVEATQGVNKNIGIVLTGFGDFSRRTFSKLVSLIGKMNEDAYKEKTKRAKFEILAIVDPDHSARQSAREYLKKENLHNVSVTKDLLNACEEIAGYKGKIIIRDVSSSDQHVINHTFCSGKKEFYHFVDKPIALSLSDLDSYKETGIFTTVLEEIENPSVLTVKEYIHENKLTINSLEFWRYSSMAWIQLLKSYRTGVRGGAYMDKSIHDWAVAYYLLNIETPDQITDPKIESKIELFMPRFCNNLHESYPKIEFYDHFGKNADKKTENIKDAEDLKMRSKVNVSINKISNVNISMNSSWGGITIQDKKEILTTRLDSSLEGALFQKTQVGVVNYKENRQVEFEFIDQELRLGKMLCTKDNGEEVHIYFNMLIRDEEGIFPFVKVVRDGRLDNIPICQRKETHLDRILEDGLLDLSVNRKPSKTGPEMSIFCHEMALKCLDNARNTISENAVTAKNNILNHMKKVGTEFY